VTHAGIDFDSHAVHVVLLPEEGPASYRRYELEGADAFERTRSVRDAMPPRTSWADLGVVACGIERPFGPNKGTLWPVFGAIVTCLPRWLLVQPMSASGWRKAVGLSGNATKKEVATFTVENVTASEEARRHFTRYPEFWPQDACDAWCIARAVQILTEDAAA
jgi:hypothetical protein